MYFVEDEKFAKQLQYELNYSQNAKLQNEKKEKENQNPVASILEITDPTPNIHDLFVKFDKRFFWSSLGMVQVLWSHKMTSCAGVCSFEGGLGLCKISLSAPLLSLRPRKDLVETLLHEMIHAYLFVTRNYKDREDHGPEFHKHMYRINKESGTNITVYHNYHDEVAYYQRHIWRCNGPCQHKRPYFGFVRRAMNRAPGPSDSWWNQHKLECNGTFIKISEPEKAPKKSKKTVIKGKNGKDIRDFFKSPPSKPGGSSSDTKTSNIKTLSDLISTKPSGGVKMNSGSGTFVITNTNKKVNKDGKSSFPTNSQKNNSTQKAITPAKPSNTIKSEKDADSKVRETVRNVWANKFPSKPNPPKTSTPKKVKVHCPICEEGFNEEELQTHAETCQPSEKVKKDNEVQDLKSCPVCGEKIEQAEMNEHLENCLNCSFVNEKEMELENEVECESVPCPCCYKWFLESEMNNHIDYCLTLNSLKEFLDS